MNNTSTNTYNRPTPTLAKANELAVLEVSQIALQLYEDQPADNKKFSAKQIEIMRNTIARGATYEELFLFMEQCLRTGLDPFFRQIYSIRRKAWNNQSRSYEEAQVIQVSIDGFRLIADRTHKYAGQVGPWWCGPNGEWREVWLSEEQPAAAKVGVLRDDFAQPLYAIALLKSYIQTNGHGEPVSRWKSDPAGMLAKCAESLALRRAFPQELSGLYTTEEMDQADNLLSLPSEPLKQLQQAQSQGQLPEGSFFNATSSLGNAKNESTSFELNLSANDTQPAEPQAEEQPKMEKPAVQQSQAQKLEELIGSIDMTLDEAKHLPDSRGTLYGNIHPDQLTYRYNNMCGMVGKVDPDKEIEYLRKMRAIQLIQADAKVNEWKPLDSSAAEKSVLGELYSDEPPPSTTPRMNGGTKRPAQQPQGQPVLLETPANPYEDLKAMADKLKDEGRSGDFTAFWLLQQRTNWTRSQALEIVKLSRGDQYAAFTALLKQLEQSQAAAA